MRNRSLVLVVEDERDIREAIQEALDYYCGHRVLAVGDGQEALALPEDTPKPDLILLDLMLPVMNGEQFMMKRRLFPKLADVPVIILSADGQIEKKTEALGADGYLKKPISLESLLKTVEHFCVSVKEMRTQKGS